MNKTISITLPSNVTFDKRLTGLINLYNKREITLPVVIEKKNVLSHRKELSIRKNDKNQYELHIQIGEGDGVSSYTLIMVTGDLLSISDLNLHSTVNVHDNSDNSLLIEEFYGLINQVVEKKTHT